jgi:hypothetical protein
MQDKLDFVGQINISDSRNDALNVNLKISKDKQFTQKICQSCIACYSDFRFII